jgi:hypothetical protein
MQTNVPVAAFKLMTTKQLIKEMQVAAQQKKTVSLLYF